MEHVVFYQSAQGVPAFRRLSSLEDAVNFAEHLRNVENITDFSVYSLSPVTLSLRAYYHVEVTGGEAASADAAPQSPPAATAPAAAPADTATLPDAPPTGAPFEAASQPAPMSFNALEEQAANPAEAPAAADVPFAAAPLPPAGSSAITETFVKDDPADLPAQPDASAEATPAIDPNVVDPTVEEVVPAAPSGRRSMGFFARS